jgi:hypothetical protein
MFSQSNDHSKSASGKGIDLTAGTAMRLFWPIVVTVGRLANLPAVEDSYIIGTNIVQRNTQAIVFMKLSYLGTVIALNFSAVI